MLGEGQAVVNLGAKVLEMFNLFNHLPLQS
jgi:hypothetical protein